MDSSQRICRFCYNTYDEKDMSVIGETETNLLGVLKIPLDLTITDCPVICTTCKEQLKDCDSFKKLCISTENCIQPYLEDNVKINLSLIYNCSNSEKNAKYICRLCMQPTDDQTVLNEKETAQFSVFFPEINLNITSSVVFCMKCYGSLQKHLEFTKTCLDWETKLVNMKNFLGQDQKMSLENFIHSLKYHEMAKEEKVDIFTEQLHLNHIKKEIDEDMEEMLKTEEEKIIAHQEQLFIKQEEIPLKSEKLEDTNEEMNIPTEKYTEDEEMNEKFMLSNSELEIKDESTLEEASSIINNSQVSRCHQTVYDDVGRAEIRNKPKFKHDDLVDVNFSDTKIVYQCKKCDYKSDQIKNLKRHTSLMHDDNFIKFKCGECSVEFKHKASLTVHILSKHTNDPPWYKCDYCNFKSVRKNGIKTHVARRHRSAAQKYKSVC